MLVLTRRVGERVVVGEEIEVTVVSVRGDQVRLGIAAPREVSIHRAEVAEAVRRENAAAARAAEAVGRGGTAEPQRHEDTKAALRAGGKAGGLGFRGGRRGALKRWEAGADNRG